MLRKLVKVSRKAVDMVYRLTKKGIFRGDVFVKVDTLFCYPAGTMAMYIGKKESGLKGLKKKKCSVPAEVRPKVRNELARLHGKVYSEEELSKAWFNQK